jgi:hypothetical protein
MMWSLFTNEFSLFSLGISDLELELGEEEPMESPRLDKEVPILNKVGELIIELPVGSYVPLLRDPSPL